jgi:autotransporter-associated beta strand protein
VASGTLNLTGVVSGSGSIDVSAGTANIGGNNSAYTGQVNINGGTVQLDNANALGSTAGATVVAEGGNLRTNGDAFTVNEPVTLNGGAIAGGGGGPLAVTFAGTVTLGAGESNFQLDGGTGDDGMTVSGNIVGSSGGNLTIGVDGGSRLLVTGAISHNGNLTKNSNGELEFQGANTYAGTTTLNDGTLDLEGANASLGAGNVSIAGGLLDISSGVLNAIANTATLSMTGGLVDLETGINELISGLVLNGMTMAPGTYGSTASAATNQNNTYFSGPGILTVGLIGDHNRDGVVDVADFVAWSKNPDGFGGANGYTQWAGNFGSGTGGGSGGLDSGQPSVPEPSAGILVLLSAMALSLGRRRG